MGELLERIGPYRALSTLGRGGMGVVYRAAHVESGEVVALKTVRTPSAKQAAWIREEIQALRSIEHPGVVRILAEGLAGGVPWYAMELLEGRTLTTWIDDLWDPYGTPDPNHANKTTPPIGPTTDATAATAEADATLRSTATLTPSGWGSRPRTLGTGAPLAGSGGAARPGAVGQRAAAAAGRLDEVLELACRLCAPLSFIHGEGLVHRDLKPGNIHVRDDGTPVLMDFGVVSRASGTIGREALEPTGSAVGTAAYVAPEQVRGRRVDARADLYALGCTLYEMITGETPFAGPTVDAILQQHLTATPRPPSELVSGVPAALDALILGLLAKDRRARIGYAEDVADALARLRAPEPPAPPRRARSYLYRPETVGRAGLLAELRGNLEAAGAGRGSFVALHGESGIGKTVLLAELTGEAVARGMRVVLGECVPAGLSRRSELDAAGTELGPIRPLLRAVAGAGIERGREVAERILGARGRLLAPYEPTIAAVPGHTDHPVPPELPPDVAREHLLAALRDTLAAFAREAPVLLVVDDLQWADDLSRSFLGSLTEDFLAGAALAVVTAHRTEETSEALRAVIAAPHVREIGIDRLGEDSVAAIVGHMLAMESPPSPFVRFLARHSEGNPFFVAEYLRAAVAERHLRRRGGAWHLSAATEEPGGLTGYEALPLPREVHDLVRVRLDALSEPARALAELGAVIGRELDGDLLTRASGLDGDVVRARIRELDARHVLEPVGSAGHRFVHDKIREVAYEGIPPERRRSLHRAVGEAIEAEGAAGVVDQAHAARLGYHFRHAGEIARAIDHLERAGELAHEKLAHEEATRHFEEAIAIEPDLPARAPARRRAKWEVQIAEAEHRQGRPATGSAHAERAAALLGLAAPRSRLHLALRTVVELGTQVEHRLFPDRFLTGTLSPEGAAQISARTFYVLLECSYMRSDALAVLHGALGCLNAAERAGPSPTLARAYGFSSVLAATLSLHRVSRTYSRRAHATLERCHDEDARTHAHTMDAFSHASRAEWERVSASGEQALAIADRLGLSHRAENIQTLLAWSEFVRGDLDASEARYARMRAERPHGETQHDLWARAGLAGVHAERGRLDEALAEVSVDEDRSGQQAERFSFRTLRAGVHLRRGDVGAARQAGAEALDLMRAMSASSMVALPSYVRATEVFVELWSRAETTGDRAELVEASRLVCARLTRGARLLAVWRPAALLAQGWHALREGDPGRARARWEASLAAARALSMPLPAALADLALGQHGPREARPAHLDRAIDAFTRLGATYRRDQALAARRASPQEG